MPAKIRAITGQEANCLAAADHFIAYRGSKPATLIRAWFDRIDQAKAFAATFGDSCCAAGIVDTNRHVESDRAVA